MKKILFVSATGRVERPYLDPSVRYRCYNPAMALEEEGFLVDVISLKKLTESIISRYDIFIFHRPSYEKKLIKIIEIIKEKNALLFADYDDLIFSSKYALESSIFKTKRATKEECLSIFNNNEKALMLFKNFIVSTQPLKEKVLELKENAEVNVINNALSEDVLNRINSQKEYHKKINSEKKVISYLSGTASHDKDFEIVENAIYKILKKYKNEVEVNIVGPLKYDKEKLHMVKHIPYVDYEYLSKLIAKTHINIAPLEMNRFTNCKSGLKFFESGILSIPSVVTPINDMLRFEDSKGIVFATTESEWYKELERLILDNNYYEEKSKNTYDYVVKYCTMKNEVEKYIKLFKGSF